MFKFTYLNNQRFLSNYYSIVYHGFMLGWTFSQRKQFKMYKKWWFKRDKKSKIELDHELKRYNNNNNNKLIFFGKHNLQYLF